MTPIWGQGGVDVSDANAVVGGVMAGETFYSVLPPKKTGTLATVALDPALNDYPQGYHAGDVLGLSHVEADLVTGNIKNGVTIFGVAGSTDVRDSTDANAGVTDVKSGQTFYAGGGAKKTGTLATVALDPASTAYPAGYHAGNGGGLPAVEADLVTGNIKSGIVIFGVTGAATIQDISAANALVTDVLSPKTFFSVTGAIKTGTLATQTLNPANDTVNAGYYAATTLHAVDADLAVGNIKSGVVIFGFTGTCTGTLADDITSSTQTLTGNDYATQYFRNITATAGADVDLETNTTTFAAGSRQVAVCMATCSASAANKGKVRLYMNGAQVAESAYVTMYNAGSQTVILVGTAALTGAKICKMSFHNYDTGSGYIMLFSGRLTGNPVATGIAVGSIKLA